MNRDLEYPIKSLLSAVSILSVLSGNLGKHPGIEANEQLYNTE